MAHGAGAAALPLLLLLLLSVAAVAPGARAVERSKFKTCDDASFCRRQRALTAADAPERRTEYVAAADVDADDDERLRATLSRRPRAAFADDAAAAAEAATPEARPLYVELKAPLRDVLHVRVAEDDPRRLRFEHDGDNDAERVVFGDASTDGRPRSGDGSAAALRARRGRFANRYRHEVEGSDTAVTFDLLGAADADADAAVAAHVTLHQEPFYVQIDAPAATPGGHREPVVRINARGLLHFEQLRSKADDEARVPSQVPDAGATQPDTWDEEMDGAWQPPLTDNAAARGRWAESFASYPDSKPHGPASVGVDIEFVGARHVYGIPEHAAPLALPPTRARDKATGGGGGGGGGDDIDGDGAAGAAGYDEPYRLYNLDVFEYELDNPMALYASVPLMLAHTPTHTVGVLWLNAAETWVDVERHGSTDVADGDAAATTHTHWFSESGVIDVYVLSGPTPRAVLEQYAALVGTAPLPPRFALGLHQCKWNYRSEAEVAEVDAGFDDANMPYDVIWLDIEHTNGKRYFTWDANHFPTPERMQAALDAKGRKLVTIVDPHLKRDDGYAVHAEAAASGVYVRKPDNADVDYDGHCWPGGSSWPDFTRRSVRDWWAGRFSLANYTHSTPTLHVWNDMNEPSVFNGPEVTMHKDVRHSFGAGSIGGGGELIAAEHRDVHNLYGAAVHEATFDGLLRRSGGALRPFVLTRAGFVGTQRTAALWTGDNTASWGHLAASMPMLLSLSVAGVPFVGADVGGFFNNPDAELYARWMQAAALQPFLRVHGHLDTKRKEAFLYDGDVRAALHGALRLRYRLLPYLYATFRDAARTGAPVMRPMWFEFPHAAHDALYAADAQFMLGGALLARPVTEQGAQSVHVTLPAGAGAGADGAAAPSAWYDLHTSRAFAGPARVSVKTPLVRGAPLFQRGGSIVPLAPRARRSTAAMRDDPFELVVAPDTRGEAHGELYVDDGESYAHRAPARQFVLRRFHWHRNALYCHRGGVAADERAAAAGGDGDAAAFVNTIERVVVHGVRGVRGARLHRRPAPGAAVEHTPLDVHYDDAPEAAKHARLIIDRLELRVTDAEWKIELDVDEQQ